MNFEHFRRYWQLPDDRAGLEAAQAWYHELCDTHYSTALHVPGEYQGRPCIVIAASTRESTMVMNANRDQYKEGGIITNPHWLYWKVWVCFEKNLMNFAGITDSTHHGGKDIKMSLGEYIDMTLGGPNWRSKYCIITSGYYLDSLRRLLAAEFHARMWLEMVCGRSMQAYRGLDLYMRVNVYGVPPSPADAWYLLNTDVPYDERYVPDVDKWWHYKKYECIGQREPLMEWLLEEHGISHAIAIPSATRRMSTVLRHVSGDVSALPPLGEVPGIVYLHPRQLDQRRRA